MITFLRFGRAHTLIGTTLSLLAIYLLAARYEGAHDWVLFAVSLFSCLAANVYITGLNQVTDVEIDRINKPYLPIASGAYSLRTGKAIVAVCGVLAVVTCLIYLPWLALTVLSSMVIGTAYSVEPVRLKQYHFWAAFCIIVVRGLIVNLLLYLHFAGELARPQVQGEEVGAMVEIPTVVWLLTAIIFVFGVIIAWFKDLPDTEGDAAHGIRTLTLLRTREWVYTRGAWLLTATLAIAAITSYIYGYPALAISLAVLLTGFLALTRTLNLNDQASIARFYQGTWVVFFGIYGVFAAFG